MISKPYSLPKKQDFAGLSNQGATCYMNSLLQTLFMTPEFRKEIYRLRHDPKQGKKEESIPFQLQVLFTKLQLSNFSVETTSLTRSFGWTHSESFQQHDVQEFCRVLFDAIEKSVKDTSQSKIIQELYEGRYVDYVKCLTCGVESTREDKFLDLSLTIRNKHEKIYNDSVEKALQNFVKPEYLTGNNKYFCENCKNKEDAIKGLKFKELPYILVLQLKRFDFDYATNHRVKINDKVSFTKIMNINSLLGTHLENSVTDMEIDHKKLDEFPFLTGIQVKNKNFKFLITKKKENLESSISKEPIQMDQVSKKKYQEIKSSPKRKQRKHEKIKKFLEEGENVYELFSVMIHSGSAWGGHYYAYIKCFETEKWYNFNDSIVTEISSKDLTKTFGEASSWGSSSSAYLLMYRKINYEKNTIKVTDEEIPKDILAFIEDQRKKIVEDDNLKKEELKKIVVRVRFCKDMKEISVKNDEKIGNLKQNAMKAYGIMDDETNVRLRELDFNNNMTTVLDDNQIISNLHHNRKVALELKQSYEDFEPYDPNKFNVRVIIWKKYPENEDDFENILNTVDIIKVNKDGKVKEFIENIMSKYDLPLNTLKIFKKGSYGNRFSLEPYNFQECFNMKISNMFETSVFLLEKIEEKGQKSKWQEVFEIESSKVTVKYDFPHDSSNTVTNPGQVSIHPHRSVHELKQIISKKVNIPENNLILKLASNLNEIKDLNLTIKQAISHNYNLLLLKGIPLKPNEIRFSLLLSISNSKPIKDGEFFVYYPLFDIPIDFTLTIKDLKYRILEILPQIYPSLFINHCRIRDIQAEKLSRWLDDPISLTEFKTHENKKLAVEILEHEDRNKEKDEIIVAIRRFFPLTWELDPAVEVKINSKLTSNNLAEVLSKVFNISVYNI